MNSRQARALRSIESALSFLKGPKITVPRIASTRADLEASLARLKGLWVAQSSAFLSRGGDGIRAKNARRELRVKQLLPIARRGKLLLKGLPGIEDALRVPHSRASDESLLDAAERIATEVRPHAKVFVKSGFARTFIRDLERAAEAFRRVSSAGRTELSRSSRLTADLREEIAHARSIVATLDSMMLAEFEADTSTIELWRRAKRIPAKLGRPRAPKSTPPTAAPD
jgi:hypothetical protein